MLTSHERRNVRNRDKVATGNDCQGCTIFELCPKQEDGRYEPRIEVHHIEPQAWSTRNDLIPDRITNVVSVCHEFHSAYPDSIHPTYKGDFVSTSRMDIEQRVAFDDGVYWNNRYDEELKEIARRNTRVASIQGWRVTQRLKENEALNMNFSLAFGD